MMPGMHLLDTSCSILGVLYSNTGQEALDCAGRIITSQPWFILFIFHPYYPLICICVELSHFWCKLASSSPSPRRCEHERLYGQPCLHLSILFLFFSPEYPRLILILFDRDVPHNRIPGFTSMTKVSFVGIDMQGCKYSASDWRG